MKIKACGVQGLLLSKSSLEFDPRRKDVSGKVLDALSGSMRIQQGLRPYKWEQMGDFTRCLADETANTAHILKPNGIVEPCAMAARIACRQSESRPLAFRLRLGAPLLPQGQAGTPETTHQIHRHG
ncbi:hypothetical protein [Herbaspirillum sp. LeCh32-8]|uniref:hypothetical protein n=1 Tax=Herbaspirillum sp. LeCh32-8 TaxID=2821356 RepID=UPI001AE5155D|nr:hypothetical protein [Herbaspirillum sp. LeCh32-8]